MGFSPILGIRIATGILSIIVLGLDGYAISAFNNTLRGSSPSSMNFIIFCCIWTWLSLAYILVTPRFLPRFHDKFVLLGVEILANIFWFSGFVAVAAYVGDHTITCPETVCGSIKATIAFGCFEWLTWVASLVLVCLSIFKGKNMLGAVPMMENRHAPLNHTGVESAYHGPGGYDPGNNQPLGFNPSETPAPYGVSQSPAPYDPHLQPAHLQPQDTGVSSVSALSSGPYAGAGGYVSAQSTGYGQPTPYDPHYSQHQEYSNTGGGAVELSGSGYAGSQARFS
ncbi:hypothetical protein H072_9578 [Dactylellina haptotyla CBS 200.50]|uniref:MARVEL domain-containing protein n=1 Tax=Dactylellina haptotyla (strain CBS 200.50) TaxID=1284197 RepID=S8BC64_DACHA|nr:hypothetical protein H072_9578 [Dactylellina haptotyla CBS 200.50]